MSQRRSWNWTDDDSTFNMNWYDLGITKPGLYTGFDAAIDHTMSLKLVMSVTGVKLVKQDLTNSSFYGVWRTLQGCIISEDADLPGLTINANASGNPRIDLIVGQHKYITTAGGAVATYLVIQGTPSATPVAPSLTFPTQQVILGTLYIPNGTTNLDDAGVIYTKARIPDFGGDETIMHTDKIQVVNKRKQMYHEIGKGALMTLSGTTLTATEDSNYYTTELPGVAAPDYVDLDTLVVPFTDQENHFTIQARQRFRILSGSGNMSTRDGNPIFIEAGEVMDIYDLYGNPNMSGIVSNEYRVVKGSEANRSQPVKFFKLVQYNISDDTSIAVGNLVNHNRDGNILIVSVDFAAVNASGGLKGMKHNGADWDGTNVLTQGGGIVRASFSDSGGSGQKLKIVPAAGGLPSAYKPFNFINHAEVWVESAAMVTLMETPFGWGILQISDTLNSLVPFNIGGFNDMGTGGFGLGYDAGTHKLVIDDRYTHFSAIVPAGGYIDDILILRGGAASSATPAAAPAGTVITLQLAHAGFVATLSIPFYFNLVGGGGNFLSTMNDAQSMNFMTGDLATRLSIPDGNFYNLMGPAGSGTMVTLRKTATNWEVVYIDFITPVAGKLEIVKAQLNTAQGDIGALQLQAALGGWIDPSAGLASGWSLSAANEFRYAKDGMGRVVCQRSIEKGSSISTGTVANLNVGYRPFAGSGSGFLSFQCTAFDTTNGYYGVTVGVFPSGVISLVDIPPGIGVPPNMKLDLSPLQFLTNA